jgi:Mor family transcriptional regulator
MPRVELQAPFHPSPKEAELSGDLSRMADVIEKIAPGQGVSAVVALCREFSGAPVYFVQEDKLFRKALAQWVVQQYDAGRRVPDIARASRRSERTIWKILGSFA